MSETVTMPKLGFDMQEGTLVRWVKAEGETVNKGEVLAEIETDKATVEVESSYSGVVARHLVSKGDVVPVGTPIAIIAQPGEKVEEAAAQGKAPEEAPAPGGRRPPAAGGEGQSAAERPDRAVQSPAARQTEKEQAEAAKKPVEEISASEEAAQEGDGRLKASPLARRIAREQGVDLRTVKGSGPGGRIIRSDVESAARQPAAAPVPAAAPQPTAAPAAVPLPPAPVWSGAAAVPQDEVIKMNRLRSAIGRRMTESKQQIPHFYVSHSIKMEKVMELRGQLNAFLPDNQKLTVNDFVLKAAALALREFRNLNSTVRGDEIVRHGHINIGVAVAVEGGLLTVVVRDADQKPLRLISQEVREMAGRVRSGKVRTEDIEGSTFSTSNLGMFDVEEFIAIINPPETAILAIASAKQVPVVEDGQLKVGTRMTATISADHRVTDGVEAAKFMQALAAYLEEPMRLLL